MITFLVKRFTPYSILEDIIQLYKNRIMFCICRTVLVNVKTKQGAIVNRLFNSSNGKIFVKFMNPVETEFLYFSYMLSSCRVCLYMG
jgi:hypothetical protein